MHIQYTNYTRQSEQITKIPVDPYKQQQLPEGGDSQRNMITHVITTKPDS